MFYLCIVIEIDRIGIVMRIRTRMKQVVLFLTKTITEAVSEAVKGISGKSGKVKIEIKVNEEVTEVPSESTE
jgi:hypothetical protein